jgi:hypothetical protein
MLKIGILGIGQAGNNIAALAKRQANFPVIAINSSEKDIETVSNECPWICFGSRMGSGKNRGLAKEYVKENIKELIADEKLNDLVNANDYIFVVSSCAGGTGSGSAPIITDVLNQYYNHNVEQGKQGKVFVNVGILPSIGESVGGQRNTIEYISEVVRLGGSYMLFDNDRVKGAMSDVLGSVNFDIVDTFKLLRGDYSVMSTVAMIDEEDSRKIISTPGLIFADIIKNVYEEKIPAGGSVEDLIVKHINEANTMIKIDRDKIIKRLAFIANLSEDVQAYFDDNLPKLREIFGEPLEDFKHNAINHDDSEANMLGVILSGMSLPENRLKMIKHRIRAVEEELAKRKESSILGELMKDVSKYEGGVAKRREATDFNLNNITNKY